MGAGYSAPITSDINWLIEADLTSSSKRFESSDNILILPSYTLVDFRFGLTGENWDLIGYANNVFNDDTVQIAFNSVDFATVNLAFFPPPTTFILTDALQATLPNKRQVGVRMSYSF